MHDFSCPRNAVCVQVTCMVVIVHAICEGLIIAILATLILWSFIVNISFMYKIFCFKGAKKQRIFKDFRRDLRFISCLIFIDKIKSQNTNKDPCFLQVTLLRLQKCYMPQGIIHLVRTKNFPKNLLFFTI